MEAVRPKGSEPSMVEIQKAFVRLDGVRETIKILMVRMNDPGVVAQATRTLAAVVQGNSVAAESMFHDGPGNIRLLLRAIERHDADPAVVENACMLIMHLCSLPPQSAAPAAHSRLSAHLEIQRILAAEGGVIDMLVHFLSMHTENLKLGADKTEQLHRTTLERMQNIRIKKSNLPGANPTTPSKQNSEMFKAWSELNAMEVTAARTQEVVLQALLLIVFGNSDNIRQLMGEFWLWDHNTKQGTDVPAADAAGKNHPKNGKRKSAQHKQGPTSGQKGAQQHQTLFDGGAVAPQTALTVEEKQSLTTLDAYAGVSHLLLEVLNGRAARDRPELASKVCRLLSIFADRNIGLLRLIEAGRSKERLEQEVRFRPGVIPADDRKPGKPPAPFLPLKKVVSALTLALRTHKQDATLLAEALSTLGKIKTLALLSAPPGVEQRSEALLYAWQRLLADAETHGELESACNFLKRALSETEAANLRMQCTGGTPDQLTGDTVYLTPRLQQVVLDTAWKAAELVGDSIASRWRNGEPSRKLRKHERDELDSQPKIKRDHSSRRLGAARQKSKKQTMAGIALQNVLQTPAGSHRSGSKSTAGSQPGSARLGSKKVLHTPAESHRSGSHTPAGSQPGSPGAHKSKRGHAKSPIPSKPETPKGRRGPRGSTEIPLKLSEALIELSTTHVDSPPDGHRSKSKDPTASSKKKVTSSGREEKKKKEKDKEKEKENMEPEEWDRVLGYDTHDELDYMALWHDPLRDALSRSMSMPSLQQQRTQKILEAQGEEPPEGDTAPRIFSSSGIFPEFIESAPGLLKTRIVLPSMDIHQFRASEVRLRQLVNSGDEVSTALSKSMRKKGCLMPVYGLQVQFKKGSRNSYEDGLLRSRSSIRAHADSPT